MSKINGSTIQLPGSCKEQVPLARFTSWRIGGKAEFLFQPSNPRELSDFLSQCPAEVPLTWLGLGSNTLIRDQGIKGVVILTLGLRELMIVAPTVIRAEAGVSCAQLARFAARHGLHGIEFLAGIPGTVGGALAMNAGCNGSETWEFIQQVETIDQQGNVHHRTVQDFIIGYRSVQGPKEEKFVAAHFQLTPGKPADSFAIIKALLERRSATQPTNQRSCGSVFKNPPADYAARLIEACGLKGLRQGGAMVSPKHANFIINEVHATAKDVEYLIQRVQDEVYTRFDVELQLEVKIVGH